MELLEVSTVTLTGMHLSKILESILNFQGHFVRRLGKIGDKETENEVLLLEHDIPHQAFSEAVNACLPKLPWVITDEVNISSVKSLI